ncbi:MAG TPA: hypothetical protein VG368_05745, partial [Acidimicrobiales bacterium]|nr:hypothetical protein [Acidimicrobiales bacterium]
WWGIPTSALSVDVSILLKHPHGARQGIAAQALRMPMALGGGGAASAGSPPAASHAGRRR